jgi:hypothetical protein
MLVHPAGGGTQQASGTGCGHPACAAAPTCIVAELEASLHFYLRGRGIDRFRMENTKRAIATLRSTTTRLASDADVDALGLGAALPFVASCHMIHVTRPTVVVNAWA